MKKNKSNREPEWYPICVGTRGRNIDDDPLKLLIDIRFEKICNTEFLKTLVLPSPIFTWCNYFSGTYCRIDFRVQCPFFESPFTASWMFYLTLSTAIVVY